MKIAESRRPGRPQAWAAAAAAMAILALGGPVGAQLAPATGASEARAGGVTPPAPAPAAVEVAPPPADSAAAGPVAASPSQPSAKALFGAMKSPAQLEARALGSYAKGCLAGARALPIDGPAWQAMRLSRNRNWGHPDLIQMVERLATEARAFDGWNGLLVGDISQPRGGPMLTGHNSHQIGLDADIWFTPMPDRRLTAREREELSATSMLAPDRLSVDPKVWSPAHVQIVKRAAGYRDVERVLVHPAIKKALCESATGDRAWLGKVRPIWGHYYHFHVRMGCPAGSTGCVPQTPPPGDDGCGKELADWYVLLTKPPEPPSGKPPPPPKPELTLDQLPAECRVVLEVGIARPAPTEARGALAPTSASTKAATSKAAATKSAGAAAVGKSDRP